MLKMYTTLTSVTLELIQQGTTLRIFPQFSLEKPNQALHQLFMFLKQETSSDWAILCDEYLWRTSGRKTIVIPSARALNGLINTGETEETVSAPPFECFSIAIPENTVIDGVKIPPCLVCWMPNESYTTQTIGQFYQSANRRAPTPITQLHSDEMVLSITYPDPYKNGKTYGRTFVTEDQFTSAIAAKNKKEFRKKLGSLAGTPQTALPSSAKDREITRILIKIIAGLASVQQKEGATILTKGLAEEALGIQVTEPLDARETADEYQFYRLKL